jgi:predicted permease
MTGFVRDLRTGAQQLGRRPGFAAAAVLSLALGIGINTTLFSVVNGVLLRDAGIAERSRLVEIYSGINQDYPQLTTSWPDYLDIRDGANAFSGVAASAYVRGILSGDRPQLVTGEAVSANYFDVLGVRLPAGRGFRDHENVVPDASPFAVISHGLWQRRFGGDPSIVGRTIELSGVGYTIIGVAPAAFTGTIPGIPADVWVPTVMVERLVFSGVQAAADEDPGRTRLERRGTRWLFVKGRLADGRTIAEARAQVEAIYARNREVYPGTNEDVTASVVPAAGVRFHPMLDGYIRQASIGLMAAVGLVLLIACANVANLMLARAVARRREFAIRSALGAGRGRLVRQLLSEGLVLASLGGAAGLLLTWWGGRALAGFGTDVFPVPVVFDFSIDRTVLTFAIAASLATALLFGLAPAWSASRPDVVETLKGTTPGAARGSALLGNALVGGQLALSLILLVLGALLARGLLAAQRTDVGFDPAPVASLQFNLKMNGYDAARATALREQALRDIRGLPGVVAAASASRLPLAPDINADSVLVPGHHPPDAEGAIIDTVRVGDAYFEAVGIPIVSGRPFTSDEIAQQRRVAVVNETMARQFWNDGRAVGRLLHVGPFSSEPYEVVGVARDHKVRSVGEAPRPYLHLPSEPATGIGLVVRSTMPAQGALPMLRRAVLAIEPDILFTEDVPAADVAAATMAPTRIGVAAVGAFGTLALLLAAVGLYGVVTQSVNRRTREIGIRVAIGARRGQVVRMILLQGGRVALAAVCLGLAGAAAAGRLLESLMYGVSTYDPIAYAAAGGLLMLVALLANLRPALAASAVDPVRALQGE